MLRVASLELADRSGEDSLRLCDRELCERSCVDFDIDVLVSTLELGERSGVDALLVDDCVSSLLAREACR